VPPKTIHPLEPPYGSTDVTDVADHATGARGGMLPRRFVDVPLLATMAAVFAATTKLTYVPVSIAGIAGLQRISLRPARAIRRSC